MKERSIQKIEAAQEIREEEESWEHNVRIRLGWTATLKTNSNILDDCRSRGLRNIPWKKGLKNRSIISGERPCHAYKEKSVRIVIKRALTRYTSGSDNQEGKN